MLIEIFILTIVGTMNLSQISEIVKFKKIVFNRGYPAEIIKLSQKFENLEVISIIYTSGKLKIHGFIFQRKGLRTPKPVTIYCRGGNNNSQHRIGELKPGSLYRQRGLLELVNSGKIIVLASNYRGSSLSEGIDEFCGKDVEDTINLYPIIRKYDDSSD